jgi:clan AA aspartic protease (TIGR02281 family)
MRRRRGDRVQGRRAYGGVLVIPCQLNDVYRYWFLADTGTALTMLSRQVAEEMGLDLTRPGRHERIASVHQVAQAPVLHIDSLQVGSRRVTDLEVLVISLPPDLRVDGLLGVNFLERFRPTFEFDETTLVLR